MPPKKQAISKQSLLDEQLLNQKTLIYLIVQGFHL